MTRLGLPIAIQQGLVAFGNGSMQKLVNGFRGTVPGVIAAFGAGIRMDSFIYVPILSFQSGLASFTGQNMGAGRLDRVKRGYLMTLIMSMSVTVLMSLLLYIFASPVVSVFGLSGDSLLIGVEQIRFLTKFFWMFSGYMTLGGLLQGSGDTILQSATTLSALAVRITTGYLLVYFGVLGYNAAWLTTPFGWLVAISISYTRFFTGGWKKKAVAGRLSRGGNG
jgi:Na+-driven multidrug efflux pump